MPWTEISEDLLRVDVPLPFEPFQVNCWLLRDGSGWAVVDCGPREAAARELWLQVAASLPGGFTRLIVTHHHVDHFALAPWFCEHFGVPLLMTRTAFLLAGFLRPEMDAQRIGQELAFVRRAGADAVMLDYVARRPSFFRNVEENLPASFERLADGQVLRVGRTDWRVIVTAGHAPGQACLHAPGVLIAADHVLGDTAPSVPTQPHEPENDGVGEFVAGLTRLRQAVPDGTLVLPSHGEPFSGLHDRIDADLDERARRLERLCRTLDEPMDAVAVTRLVFPGGRANASMMLRLGTVIANLRFLEEAGVVERRRGPELDQYSVRRPLGYDEALGLLGGAGPVGPPPARGLSRQYTSRA